MTVPLDQPPPAPAPSPAVLAAGSALEARTAALTSSSSSSEDARGDPTAEPAADTANTGDTAHTAEGIRGALLARQDVPLPERAKSNVRSDQATVVCVANQKGGVGKTTTAVSLAAALAQLGSRILLVDLDPQGNATTGLGLRAEEGEPSSYGVLVDGLAVSDARATTDVPGLHVLPSSLDLAGAEVELVPAFSRELKLRRALEPVADEYDVILVDCPPSLGLLTINALVAADQVLVPIQCEYYALEGLGQLMRTVQLVGDSLNRGLELGGVVLTMFDGRTNLAQQVVDEVRGYFGTRAYATVIPRTVRLSEAPSFGQPITTFDPQSRGSRAYQRLAAEFADRLGLEVATVEESPLDRLLSSMGGPSPVGGGPGTAGATVEEPGQPRA